MASLKEVKPNRLVLTIAKCDEIKFILNNEPQVLLNEFSDALNGPKLTNFRLVAFEVRLEKEEEEEDQEIAFGEYVPVLLKFDKMSQSINQYMQQEVKTGSASLILLPKKGEDRDLYAKILELTSEIFPPEYLDLISNCPEDNLLPPKIEDQMNEKDGNSGSLSKNPVDDTKHPISTAETNRSDHRNTGSSTKGGGGVKKNGVGKIVIPSKTKSGPYITNTLSTKPKNPSTTTTKTPSTSSPQKKEDSTVQTDISENEPAKPVHIITLKDVLYELMMSTTSSEAAISRKDLQLKPEHTTVINSVSKKPLIVRFINQLKVKCPNCSVVSAHKCRLESSNGSSIQSIFIALRDGKILESPASAITLSVLVNDEKILDWLDSRSINDDSAKSLQLKSTIDLNYCLESMQKKEDMGKDSLVDCSKCEKKTEREICYIIEKAPELLLIQLKRFKTQIDYKTEKIEKKKNRLMVELHEFIKIKDQEYELFGVVNHFGELDSGHYTAYVKRPSDSQWFLFDDEEVTRANFKAVNTEAAYMLFFKEVGPVEQSMN